MAANILVLADETEVIQKLAKLIEDLSNNAIIENNRFCIGVSGGSIINFLTKGLPTIKTDFKQWKIFFCDERVVPVNDPESTFGAYKNLMHILNLHENNFITIKQGVTADEAAVDYRQKMARHFPNTNLPQFDLLLLGMGPDGHTCSLFPNHPLLEENTNWVASITDSPKPPSARITLTFPVINNAKCCIFALTGAGKAEMVKRVLVDKEDLPVTRVKPTAGTLYWLVDKEAGKHLN